MRNVMLRPERIIFCANQVSLCIAVSLSENDHEKVSTIIFYMPERCDSKAFEGRNVYLIEYSKVAFIWFLFKTFFLRPREVTVPHMKIGRFINAYAKYARELTAIDDGMDTFREQPKNITPDLFQMGSKYYTFSYDFLLASWLNKFSIQKVCDIAELASSSRPVADVSEFDTLIVESPGVTIDENRILINKTRSLVVKHPNHNKNEINLLDNLRGAKVVKGSDIAIEKTIKEFSGTLFIGESMVLVYALLCGNRRLKINAMLNSEAHRGLKSLHRLFEKASIFDIPARR